MTAQPQPWRPSLTDPGRDMLLSAFKTLSLMSPKVVTAMTVSIPVDDVDELSALQALSLYGAKKYGMAVEMTVRGNHVRVRLVREEAV